MKRSCFTLVELLVVIAVITLLMALTIGVLHSSKQRAKSFLCMSRIRQLAVGLTMYEEENQTFPYGFRHGFTPPPGGYPGDPAYDMLGWWWFHSIQGYGNMNGGIFCCPSNSLRLPRLKRCVLYGNYGVNLSICKSTSHVQNRGEEFAGTPLAGGDVPQPSRTLLIVDSGYSVIGWWHATDVPPAPPGSGGEDMAYIPGLKINGDRNLPSGLKQDAVKGRHPAKTVNVGFADGHSGLTKAEDLFVEKSDDGYKNRTPLWLPK